MNRLTPTAFLYEAVLAGGGRVPAPRGKVIEYHPIEPGPLKGQCWLCGRQDVSGYPKKKVISDMFSDSWMARAPWSDTVCDACTWALSYKTFRLYSILATPQGAIHPGRQEARDFLISPPEAPFLIVVAESGQKWLHYKSQVALTKNAIPVQLEDMRLLVHPSEFAKMVGIFEEMLTVFSKTEIGTGGYQINRIREYGIGKFESDEDAIRPHRGSSLFRLALKLSAIPEREIAPKGHDQAKQILARGGN